MTETPVGGAPLVDADGRRDFTIHRPPIEFRVGDDVFRAPNVLAIPKVRKLAGLHAEMGDVNALVGSDEGIERLLDLTSQMFGLIIGGADGRRFVARLNSAGDLGDPDADPPVPPDPEPIDLVRQAMPILYFLLESYGLRPTLPSSSSPNGSTDGTTDTPSDGISSTAGASSDESST